MKIASKRKSMKISARRKPRAIVKRAAPLPVLSLPEKVEQVLIGGDLTPLSPQERVEYYRKVCQSLGLNWLTQPFTYILFRETDRSAPRLQLYANKDCAAQLRKLYRISVIAVRRNIHDNMSTAEADVRDGLGKQDTAIGVVPLWKWKDSKKVNLDGRELANAIMKTETKAKRRATLSICGLSFLDESELDTMQVLGGVTRDGRIYQFERPQLPEAQEQESLQEGADLHDKAVELARANTDSQLPFKELVAQKEAELRKGQTVMEQPSLFYVETKSGLFELLGSESLLKQHKEDLLTFLDQPASKAAHARLMQPEQLGKLLGWCERNKVPIRALEKNA